MIRIRAETDQFLLSCIELATFVRWLDALFAALNVAPAMEEREFPRDMSLPRVARIRWFRGETQGLRDDTTTTTTTTIHHSAVTPRPHVGRRPVEPYAPLAPDGPSASAPAPAPAPLEHLPTRLSTTSYPNESLVPGTQKWCPRHRWTSAHDMVYAKLCYATLGFRSPRKSNYVIAKGKKWFVDWTTGKMIRVLPPGYGEVVLTGPFQTFSAENRRI